MHLKKLSKILLLIFFVGILFYGEGILEGNLFVSENVCQQSVKPTEITSVTGYQVDGVKFTPMSQDPSIAISMEEPVRANSVSVKLTNKVLRDTRVQVYYDLGEGFTEDNSLTCVLEKGSRELDISIPMNVYFNIRLDVDGMFLLDKVDLFLKDGNNHPEKHILYWGSAFLFNILMIFLLNRKLNLFQMTGLKEWRQHRKFRMTLFGIFCLVSFLFVHSLYLQNNCYYIKNNDTNNILLRNLKGYQAQGSQISYLGQGDSGFDVKCTDNTKSILLYFDTKPEENVDVKYTQLGENSKEITGEKSVTWKKGTCSIELSDLKVSGAWVRVSIPHDFVLSHAYYKLSQGNERDTKFIMGIVFLIFSYIFGSLLVCSVSVCNMMNGMFEKGKEFIFQIKIHYKKILKKVLLYIVTLIGALLVNYAGGSIFGWEITGKSHLFFAGVISLIDIMIYFHGYVGKRIELIGFLVILLVGSMFSFLSPPYLGISWDDETHYRNAVTLSHFADGKISKADEILLEDYGKNALNKEYYSKDNQLSYSTMLNQLENAGFYTAMDETSFAIRNVVYLPSALGLILGRGLGLPYQYIFILGKWMNVLLLAVLSYFAMRQLKSGKIVVLLVALIPTNIFCASNYTYDTWLIAWIILGLSAFIGEWQRPEEKMKFSSKCLIIVPLCIAVLAKETYFIITFVALFLPNQKFKDKKEAWRYRGGIVGAMLLPFIFLYFGRMGGGNVTALTDTRGGEQVASGSQLDFILQNPWQTVKILVNYLLKYLNPFYQGKDYLGLMGYFGFISIPSNLVLATLVLGALFSRQGDEIEKYPWWFRMGIVAEYIAIGAMAALSMYLIYTPVGSDTVEGCQGRYLLPVIFPVLYVLTRIPGKTYVKNYLGEENLNMILLGVMVISALSGLWTQCLMLY